jgi:hypothetical protein
MWARPDLWEPWAGNRPGPPGTTQEPTGCGAGFWRKCTALRFCAAVVRGTCVDVRYYAITYYALAAAARTGGKLGKRGAIGLPNAPIGGAKREKTFREIGLATTHRKMRREKNVKPRFSRGERHVFNGYHVSLVMIQPPVVSAALRQSALLDLVFPVDRLSLSPLGWEPELPVLELATRCRRAFVGQKGQNCFRN